MTPAPSTRLPAAERRQALIETATELFSARSYRGVTTADVAREAGVSEPILYRHFASKRELYLACVERAWELYRNLWEAAVERAGGPGQAVRAMGETFLVLHERKVFLANFWVQAFVEASDDAELRRHLRRHLRDVHDFVRDVAVRAQDEGGIPTDRDVDAEAWIFIAVALLTAFVQRLGGLVGEEEFARIVASRRRWLTGE